MTSLLAYISSPSSYHSYYHPYYYPYHIHHYYGGYGYTTYTYDWGLWQFFGYLLGIFASMFIFALFAGLISSYFEHQQRQADAALTTDEIAERLNEAQSHIDDPYRRYAYETELRNINRLISALAGRNEPQLKAQANEIRRQIRAHA